MFLFCWRAVPCGRCEMRRGGRGGGKKEGRSATTAQTEKSEVDTRRGGFKRGKVHFSRHLPKLQTNRQRHLYRTLQWVKRFSQATHFDRQKPYLNLSHKSWILMTTYYLGRRTSRALTRLERRDCNFVTATVCAMRTKKIDEKSCAEDPF